MIKMDREGVLAGTTVMLGIINVTGGRNAAFGSMVRSGRGDTVPHKI
jgi:hypothetical protein